MAQNFIVTGAASGIGLVLCQRLLQLGHNVCACDINEQAMHLNYDAILDNGADTIKKRLMIQVLDVRSSDNWQAVIDSVLDKWQTIDVLCNVAGVLKDNWVADIEVPNDVDLHFDINVKGTIYGTQSVIDTMLKQKSGHIINVASLAALTPVPGLSLYSASKYAVRAYSLAAGMELAPKGIAVTTLCPDAVQTPMLDIQKDKPQASLTFSGSHTLTADEVVDAIVGPVLKKRPLEMILPYKRGVVSKIANAFPQTTGRFIGMFRKQGERRQKMS